MTAQTASIAVRKADLLTVLLAGLVAASCTSSNPPPQPSGGELARTFCTSCHVFPTPGLLDRPSWNNVLPFMGGRLGIYTMLSRDTLIAMTAGDGVDADSLYPAAPALTPKQWDAIVAYYMHEAPQSVAAEPRTPPLNIGVPGFEIRSPGHRFRVPLTTMVEIEDDYRIFFVGNHEQHGTLIAVTDTDDVQFTWDLEGAPIASRWDDGRLLILVAGSTIGPTDRANGSLQVVDGPGSSMRSLITGLKRPVDLDLGDLNGDGRQDFVVCEFGNHTGFLSWYEDMGDGETYRRHVLSNQPGAVSAEVRDLNDDGHLDVGVLMAQGDEGIDLYINDGDGRFEQRRVLRFSPTYGSNHFEFVDFNADGVLDILYVNGDNADITPILKPYHGVRIFLGSRDGSYEERYFFPLHGAVSAQAADFDQDGDLDIAAISYFPDYAEAPEESFVLLRNDHDLSFTAFTFEESFRGRWLTMAVGDMDGDEDPDILLGSNIGFGPLGDTTDLYQRWVREAPSIVILENK